MDEQTSVEVGGRRGSRVAVTLRRLLQRPYRAAWVVTLGSLLFLFWLIGAVGVIGSSGDPADRMYLTVPLVLAVGAAVSRLRATGMAWTLGAAAVTCLAIGAIAVVRGLGPVNPVAEIVGLNVMFASMFAAAAALFRRAT